MLPYTIVGGVSGAVLGLTLLPKIRRWFYEKSSFSKDPASKPLLSRSSEDQEEEQQQQQQENERIERNVATYGSIFDQNNNEDRDITTSEEAGKDNKSEVVIATVVRSTSERIRLFVEWLVVVLQVVLAMLAIGKSSINDEWDGTISRTPKMGLLLWIYVLCLVSIRLVYSKSTNAPPGGLWYHCTCIYSALFVAGVATFRSAIMNHTVSDGSKYYYIVNFILCTVLLYLTFTSRFGNSAPRLYITPGVTPSNEPVSSLFSLMTFSFVNRLIFQGYRQYLTLNDVWDLKEEDHAYYILNKFRRIKKRASLVAKLIRNFKIELSIAGVYALLISGTVFAPAVLVKAILDYVEDPTIVPRNVAWLYVIAIFLITMVDSMLNGQALFIGRRICIRMRAIIIGEAYAKALRRKVAAGGSGEGSKLGSGKAEVTIDENGEEVKAGPSGHANIGAIINLMAIDAFKVSEICGYLHYFVSGTLQIILCIALLYFVLDWSAAVGALAMFAVFPLNYWFSRTFARYQNELMLVTDERVEKTNELLQSIRIIKYFGWEQRFANGVAAVRDKELKVLWKRYVLWSYGAAIWFGTPIVVTVASFASFTLIQGRTLTSPIAFTAMTLFNIMKVPMDQIADMLSNVLQGKVSLDRVDDFLSEDETDKYNQLRPDQPRGPNSPYIGFENASFSWNKNAGPLNENAAATATATGSSGSGYDFKIRDVNLSFPVGQLSVIVGQTGSGKTSLLMALLGEMDILEGRVFLPGGRSREDVEADPETGLCETVAYCSQQAWLLNDTLKNNILFASDFDEDRYNAVLEACALKRDLEILDAGDQTEVGEKGITLSGGQKQRISLARAMYSRSKHLLLDDCLSAVDSHTALYIYEHALTGPMAEGRTIILVSHNVALTITQAAHVVVMENGRIRSHGTPQAVVATGALGEDDLIRQSASQSASQVASRVGSSTDLSGDSKKKSKSMAQEINKRFKKDWDQKRHSKHATTSSSSGGEDEDEVPEPEVERAPPQLVQDETMASGYVSSDVYLGYIKAVGDLKFWAVVVASYVFYQGSNILLSWWIREWTVKGLAHKTNSIVQYSRVPMDHSEQLISRSVSYLATSWKNGSNEEISVSDLSSEKKTTIYYLSIYVVLGIISLLVAIGRELISYTGGVRASRNLFNDLMGSVLGAKIRFFDSTPLGRIMNRFSKDVEGVDQDLPSVAMGFVHCILSALSIAMLIVAITPGFIFGGIFIFALYYAIAALYLASSRELKRIDSVTKSPIYQHFGETLVGISTIRAYGDQKRFIRENMARIDSNSRPFFYLWSTNRWLSIRTDIGSGLVSFGAAAFVLLSLGKIDSGLAGLSLSYALTFNDNILWVVRLYAQMEMNMNSVERMQEYSHIEPEGKQIVEDNRPPADWPNKGEIDFNNLSLRYAPELPLVIKNATFKVKPFNKVGIVGRTGAGKSTIITALFRFLEAETGGITVDGIDISTIGLRDLRQALAIIPQDPTLFIGTIRNNLDPFEQYNDREVFEALRRVHLISKIPEPGTSTSMGQETDDGENVNKFLDLNSTVSEGGNNLSQGQRQLMCLARSLLKSPKILLLDEATASIDYDTDAKIQQTIRGEFTQTTLLTIAHRLRSIIDYDMILVMDQGQIVEYDKPFTLLQRDSIFRDMCAKSGDLEVLESLAEKAFKEEY